MGFRKIVFQSDLQPSSLASLTFLCVSALEWKFYQLGLFGWFSFLLYLLGYYASGRSVRFCKIPKRTSVGFPVHSGDIRYFLNNVLERFRIKPALQHFNSFFWLYFRNFSYPMFSRQANTSKLNSEYCASGSAIDMGTLSFFKVLFQLLYGRMLNIPAGLNILASSWYWLPLYLKVPFPDIQCLRIP